MSVRSARYNLLSLRNPKGLTVIPEERDAWAFLDAAAITSSREQRAVIELVRGLKHAQLWTKMKAIYPFVGGTATTHKFNLKDPRDADAAFRLSFSGGWTHASTGADPNGTNAYADTFYNMLSNASQNSTSMSIYIGDNNTSGGTQTGVSNDASQNRRTYYQIVTGTPRTFLGINGSPPSDSLQAEAAPLGMYIGSRSSSTALALYINNTKYTANQNSAGLANYSMYFAAYNLAGTAAAYASSRFLFALLGDGLTDTDATALYNIVQQFQTSLGRQV